MANVYVTALTESLEKKIEILNEIHKRDEEQLEIAGKVPFSFEDFDKNAEAKNILIYKLNKLDEGFESVFEKVKTEINENKPAYALEIKRMQELISRITDLSTKIQAEEARNKAAIEKAFKSEKEKIKTNRSTVKAINSYSRTMKSMPLGISDWNG